MALLARLRTLLLAVVASAVFVATAPSSHAADTPGYGIAAFEADVTIPVGHACMGGGIADAKEVVDPLLARGFVFLGAGEPTVVVAVDWCQLNDDAYDYWRDVLAKAAGTTRQRVLLATVHQHEAPICDLRAQALLDAQGLKNSLCDADFCRKAAEKTAAALSKSLASPRRVTHVGVGQAKVEQLASNRRVVLPDGKIEWSRTSADRRFDQEPEGLIDPILRTISLWDGDTPLVAWHTYAVHPMSYYGKGLVSADFVGMARAKRQADDPGIFQIYFTGCAGDTTCGKYNDGKPEERPLLADRLYQGMVAAWKNTQRSPLKDVTFRCAALRLPPRGGKDFEPEDMQRILADAKEPRWRRNCAALGLSWRGRIEADQPITVPCLDFGPAQFLVMPAETFVGYQLAAQQMRPQSSVIVAGFGDGAPGYIPTDICYKEGYEDHYCWAAPMVGGRMLAAMREALGADRYRIDPTFPPLPPNIKLGAVSGVAINAAGNILVFNRAEPPILVFSPEGKFLRSFGDKLYTGTHGIRLDADGNVWTTDYMNHTVLKLSPKGKVLLTLGEKDKPGADEKHFNRPTDIAFAKNGDVYISDGYGNSRIVQFDKDGKFIRAWGKRGKGDGEFHLPHAVRVDSKGQVYVGDRENNRIQVFTPEGKFLRKIEGIAPFGLAITKEDILFVADGRANEVVKMTNEGQVLARWGSKGRKPGTFDLPHCVAVGADGSVYVGDINGKRIQRFVPEK